MSRYRVGIMGAGMMAQGYDGPGDAHVLTMAHAFGESADFILSGFYDVAAERAEAAEQKWGCPSSPRGRDAWLREPWDVVYVATPDAQHTADLADVLEQRPKAVLVEKPVSPDGDEGLRLLRESERLGVVVLVNYPRRWHSATAKVSDAIASGVLGEPLSAVFAFSGGLGHNGVHMLDLFHGWWGDGWEFDAGDGSAGSRGVGLRRGERVVETRLVELSGSNHYVFEMHVYCEHGKIELSRSPEILELSVPRPHPRYESFRVLRPSFRTDMEEEPLLARVVGKLAEALRDPAEARMLARRELGSHRLVASALRLAGGLENASATSP